MKILHLADLHIGKTLKCQSLLENGDQKEILYKALDVCKKYKIYNIIISGDVFDRSVPSTKAVDLLDEWLSDVVIGNKIKVYIVSGNHDSASRLGCFSKMTKKAGLFICNDINGLSMGSPEKLIDPNDNVTVNLYSLPYLNPLEIKSRSGNDNIKSFEDSIKEVLSHNPIDVKEINILNTHYFVVGENGSKILNDDGSETKNTIGTIDEVSYKHFKQFDYVALGHLHQTQDISKKKGNIVRYAGSPFIYSLSEINQKKVFTIIDIKSKNNISIIEEKIKPSRKVIICKNKTFKECLEDISNVNDYVYFILSDSKIEEGAGPSLKSKYHYFLGMEYESAKFDAQLDADNINKYKFNNMSMSERFLEFYRNVTSLELNDNQLRIIGEIAKEIE